MKLLLWFGDGQAKWSAGGRCQFALDLGPHARDRGHVVAGDGVEFGDVFFVIRIAAEAQNEHGERGGRALFDGAMGSGAGNGGSGVELGDLGRAVTLFRVRRGDDWEYYNSFRRAWHQHRRI